MAINDNKIDINIDAEKTAFSDKIVPPNVYRDMAKPSDDTKAKPFVAEFSKPESFGDFKFEKSFMGLQNEKPFTLESQPLKFDQSTSFNLGNESKLMSGLEDNKNLQIMSNLLSSQQLTNTSLSQQPGLNVTDVNKQISKALNGTIAPAIENLSQHVMQMSHLDPDHKNVHDELPTIPPTNLAFVDRSAAAMDRPTWA